MHENKSPVLHSSGWYFGRGALPGGIYLASSSQKKIWPHQNNNNVASHKQLTDAIYVNPNFKDWGGFIHVWQNLFLKTQMLLKSLQLVECWRCCLFLGFYRWHFEAQNWHFLNAFCICVRKCFHLVSCKQLVIQWYKLKGFFIRSYHCNLQELNLSYFPKMFL